MLFFIRLSNRRGPIAGITRNPDARWIKQTARNTTASDSEILVGIRYLIVDRDAMFTTEYREFLKREGIEAVRLSQRLPNLNAYAERLVRTIKESCLSRMIFFGKQSMRTAINEFVRHYHHNKRNHQGLGIRLIDPADNVGLNEGPIACRQRLGGLLQYYYRQAA